MKNINYNAKADIFQQQIWDFGHNAENAYEHGDFEQAAHWLRSQDAAAVAMNYYIELHIEQLAAK